MNGRVLVLGVLFVFGSVAACGGDGDGASFSFADDDLCEWITADDVAGFFGAVHDWGGTAVAEEMNNAEPDECRWVLTSERNDQNYEVVAGNADPWFLTPYDEIVEFDRTTMILPGTAVSGHPALSDGVVVQAAGWGFYAFWVPPHEEYLFVIVNNLSPDEADVDLDTDEDQLFALADQFVSELGWRS